MTEIRKILCVDDDEMSRFVMQKFVAAAGEYSYVEADSGMGCLNYLTQNKVDLVILDFNLGDIDGLSICELINSITINADVPIIISSALDRQYIQRRNHCPNIINIVQKPYRIEQFGKDLAEAFGT